MANCGDVVDSACLRHLKCQCGFVVKQPNEGAIENAFEQLTSRSSTAAGGPVGTVHYVYDLDGHLVAEADAATGASLRDYIWLPANDNGNDTLSEVRAADDRHLFGYHCRPYRPVTC